MKRSILQQTQRWTWGDCAIALALFGLMWFAATSPIGFERRLFGAIAMAVGSAWLIEAGARHGRSR